jgi:hypothetical protein
VKVLDFGIAKAEERATKTVGGTIKGKYGYMSPEQCKGKPIDRRSDIFALGICLYELTTLRRAFKGNDDFETMKRIVSGDMVLPSVAVPGYPRELEAILLTALANDPNARFQSGQEMIEALDAFAVRAKLTGSGTAMGRFMVQLFGAKKEPWVDGGNGERTQITIEDQEFGDDAKTSMFAGSYASPAPGAQVPIPHAPRPLELAPPADAAAWQGTAQRPSGRMPAQRSTPSRMASVAPPAGPDPTRQSGQLLTLAPAPPVQQPPRSQMMQAVVPPGMQHPPPKMTPNMQPAMQPVMQSAPQLLPPPPAHVPPMDAPMPVSEPTNLGAKALLDDPRFGWGEQQPAQQAEAPAVGADLGGGAENFNIRSNSRWVILAVFLIVTAGGAIAILALR